MNIAAAQAIGHSDLLKCTAAAILAVVAVLKWVLEVNREVQIAVAAAVVHASKHTHLRHGPTAKNIHETDI